MNKVDIIANILKKFHDPTKTDVLVDKGKIVQAVPKTLSFTKKYEVYIALASFNGDLNQVVAHLLRFLRDYEPQNQENERLGFEVLYERETEAFIEIWLAITDTVSCTEEGEDIHVNVC